MAARKKIQKTEKTALDEARDELFSHIHRCGVIQAAPDEQVEWMRDTVEFMIERYPDLSQTEIRSLGELGLRFCQPVIPHGQVMAKLDEDADAA